MDHALQEIGQCLEKYGKTLSDYGLPEPMSYGHEVVHELAKWSSDRDGLSLCADAAANNFNQEQRFIYDLIITAVVENQPLLMFIDGKAGTGKLISSRQFVIRYNLLVTLFYQLQPLHLQHNIMMVEGQHILL
jgi:hypothetical protein